MIWINNRQCRALRMTVTKANAVRSMYMDVWMVASVDVVGLVAHSPLRTFPEYIVDPSHRESCHTFNCRQTTVTCTCTQNRGRVIRHTSQYWWSSLTACVRPWLDRYCGQKILWYCNCRLQWNDRSDDIWSNVQCMSCLWNWKLLIWDIIVYFSGLFHVFLLKKY